MNTPSVTATLVALLASLGPASHMPAAPAPAAAPDLAPAYASQPHAVRDTIRPVATTSATLDVVPFARPDVAAGEVRRHALSAASTAGFDEQQLRRALRAVDEEIARGGFPGAAIAIGRYDHVVVEHGAGRLGWAPHEPRVDPDFTVYDLASLTKVVAATTAVMLLVEDEKMRLDAPVYRYLPQYVGGGREHVTIRHLLTHTSGLPAGANISAPSPLEALHRAFDVPLRTLPGRRVEYSDIGFIILWAAAERAAEEPLFRLLDRRVYGPLGMFSTTFLPGEFCDRCAPTLRRADGTLIRGRVHDPTAFRLGGVTGNAGLFSTAHDMARFASMLANGGELDGVRVLREETVRSFAQRQAGAGTRALGWDTPSRDGTGAAGLQLSPRAFGHTGFTGTSLWIDPDRGTWTVLLSNRTFEPRGANRIQAVRRSVHDWVSLAATGTVAGPVLAR
jgi:serine-type D-Ala-D-Ala carboxypeptidase